MKLADRIALVEEFERSAETRRRRILQQLQDEERRFDDQLRIKEQEEKTQNEFETAMAATSTQLTDFTARLDRYDTAIVDALMENGRALEEVRGVREQMHSHAIVLPDGRRAFPSRDGVHIFDEDGAKVGQNVLEAVAVGKDTPTWEAWQDVGKRQQVLEARESGLLVFQAHVDNARERVRDGELSKDDLKALNADLDRAMPEMIRQKVVDPNAQLEVTPSQTRAEPAEAAQAAAKQATLRANGFAFPR